MPSTALKHLAKKAKVSTERAEHLWHKAKGIVSAEYPEAAKDYYALVMGITKKMMGLGEALTEDEQTMTAEHGPQGGMENLIRNLFMAQRCAHVHHWKVKSLSLHLALGDLYETLIEFADELMEMYMGAYGADEVHISQSDPNHFSEQDPVEFIRQLHDVLKALEKTIPQDGFLVNKFQELQGTVARTKYKMENLK
jgi:DNA-binding ferritin-like protein